MRAQQKTAYSGRMTAGAKKRCIRAIYAMSLGVKGRWIVNPDGQMSFHTFSFVTLTVSDISEPLDGKTAHKKLLAPFLDWLRKTKKVSTYIWKAERQANGQLHYHITTPSYIPWKEIRSKWNSLQDAAGIIDKYRAAQLAWHKDGFKLREGKILEKWPEEKQRAAYKRGMETNWSDPNSTDVHKVYKVKDIPGYLIKEITKNCQNADSVGGKVWDCSENLNGAKFFDCPMNQYHHDFMETAVANGLATKKVDTQFVLYKFLEERVHEYLLTEKELKQYNTYIMALQEVITYEDP